MYLPDFSTLTKQLKIVVSKELTMITTPKCFISDDSAQTELLSTDFHAIFMHHVDGA